MAAVQGARPPVDFVVLGAMKAMTTSVLAALGQHPGVAVSAEKETQYFVAETGHRRGDAWYAEQFAAAGPDQLRGEASPQYTFFPVYDGVPGRMAASAPDARLVYLLREPVARMASQWRHARARGVENRPLAQALLTESRYLFPSMYWLQVRQYLRHFPESSLLVVDTDRLMSDPAGTLRQICAHIGADPDRAPQHLPRLNVGDDNHRPAAALRTLRRHHLGRRVERRLEARLPARAGSAWARLTTRQNPAETPDAATVARLRDVLASDTAGLAAYLGADAPAWTEDLSEIPARAAR